MSYANTRNGTNCMGPRPVEVKRDVFLDLVPAKMEDILMAGVNVGAAGPATKTEHHATFEGKFEDGTLQLHQPPTHSQPNISEIRKGGRNPKRKRVSSEAELKMESKVNVDPQPHMATPSNIIDRSDPNPSPEILEQAQAELKTSRFICHRCEKSVTQCDHMCGFCRQDARLCQHMCNFCGLPAIVCAHPLWVKTEVNPMTGASVRARSNGDDRPSLSRLSRLT